MRALICAASGFLVIGCSASESPRTQLPLVVDSGGITTVQTNRGYAVTLMEARVAVANFVFAIAGEQHLAQRLQDIAEWLLPAAYAHPGHHQGGDVTGELQGHFVIDWIGGGGKEIGTATLLAGRYESVSFTLSRAATTDGLAAADPMVGHTALFKGTAEKTGKVLSFTVVLDSQEGRVLEGSPFVANIDEARVQPIGFRLATLDPREGDTLFDDIDFAVLDGDGDGEVVLSPEGLASASLATPAMIDAYNTLRRTFQTHDHFEFRLRN